MKIFHSLDIKSQQARIEKTVIDPYDVHTEDYEDLNDIIRRAVRTKTKPNFGDVRNDAEYDEALDDVADEFEKLSEELAAEDEAAAAEQSEAAAAEVEADTVQQTQ